MLQQRHKVFYTLDIINIMNPIQNGEDNKLPTSVPGNASNPPANGSSESENNQLLGKEAEKYLREAGNIEDLPDEEDWQESEQTKKQEKGE